MPAESLPIFSAAKTRILKSVGTLERLLLHLTFACNLECASTKNHLKPEAPLQFTL